MPCVAIGARDEEEEEVPEAPRPSLKVLFVNVDEVLNHSLDPRALHLDEGPCHLLKELLRSTGAKLVLTSHWRRHKA